MASGGELERPTHWHCTLPPFPGSRRAVLMPLFKPPAQVPRLKPEHRADVHRGEWPVRVVTECHNREMVSADHQKGKGAPCAPLLASSDSSRRARRLASRAHHTAPRWEGVNGQLLGPPSRVNDSIGEDITDVVSVEEAQAHLGAT